MPEMRFRVRWPDGVETSCYSPSLVVEDYLSPGSRYELASFVERATTALRIASDRVEAKYGVPCGRALAECEAIQRRAGGLAGGGQVDILAFERLEPETRR